MRSTIATTLTGLAVGCGALVGLPAAAGAATSAENAAPGYSTVLRSGHGCSIRVKAWWNPSGNRYTYKGGATCGRTRSMKVWCFPVHRHGGLRPSWHSHTGDIVQSGPARRRSLATGQATKGGTNGDRYKINCKLEVDGSRRVVVESGQFNL
ncbi:hypothetical protein [Nonomuraea sp. NPDC049480]|uniref:hypothetical protein n=1 Tax=Nonomuraea sp. NPDC049480 TaxID=3364353 RepID=UPI0037B75697